MLIAHETEKTLRDALIEVNDPAVEAIIQAGANLATARVGTMAEFWMDKPVIAINTATYWHAPRMNGIQDKVHGFGSLLSQLLILLRRMAAHIALRPPPRNLRDAR